MSGMCHALNKWLHGLCTQRVVWRGQGEQARSRGEEDGSCDRGGEEEKEAPLPDQCCYKSWFWDQKEQGPCSCTQNRMYIRLVLQQVTSCAFRISTMGGITLQFHSLIIGPRNILQRLYLILQEVHDDVSVCPAWFMEYAKAGEASHHELLIFWL